MFIDDFVYFITVYLFFLVEKEDTDNNSSKDSPEKRDHFMLGAAN